jgi:hypothetical protein
MRSSQTTAEALLVRRRAIKRWHKLACSIGTGRHKQLANKGRYCQNGLISTNAA